MNWIIKNKCNLKFHTSLNELIKPLKPYIKNYKWVISDLDFMADHEDLPINLEDDYFILSSSDFQKITDDNIQIIWGTLLAVPDSEIINIDESNLPYTEGNDNIWRDGNIQLNNAEIEIDCYDSSYTIIKFKSSELSQVFKEYFNEAIELEKFR